MNLFLILLLIALIAAGYYVYQRLLAIEREIRADQHVLGDEDDRSTIAADSEPPAPETGGQLEADGDLTADLGIKEQIGLAVEGTPGLAQTELYAKFPDVDRRVLQKLLRELDQAGRLRREKKGSSYRLYPL